jgi:hypothetical protein
MADKHAKSFVENFDHWFATHIAEFHPSLGLTLDPPPKTESFITWVGAWGISRGFVLSLVFIGFLLVLSIQVPNLAIFAFGWLAGTAPIWLPVVMYMAAWKAWLNFAKSSYLLKLKPVVLEVKIPREITKSPRAMELVFTNMYISSGEVTFIHRAWYGGTRPWFSFEMASFGGEIHFYVWTAAAYRRVVETSIYAQYPEVEIVEVEDYMSKFHYDPKIHTCRVGDYIYKNPDEYPIKTYVDFELDKDPKEEHLVDPLATSFETLSNLKPTEQVWIQMLFRYDTKDGIIIRKAGDWKERVAKAVEKIRGEMVFKADPDDKGFPRPTWKQNELMRAMERQLTKMPFQVGFRFAYISEGELHGPTFTAIRWIYKLYNWENFGQLIRSGRGHDPFDYPWQDFKNIRWVLVTRRWLDAMRRRSYFTAPWVSPWVVMTPEIMASLYHYPSGAIKTPGLLRIQATKSEPPPNLPR